MQRTVYAYELKIIPGKGKNVKKPESYLEDMGLALKKISDYEKPSKTEDYKSDRKVLYIDKVAYDENTNIIELVFISARYGVVRKVMNTLTCEDRGILKSKPDGDLEKTHVFIKAIDKDTAVALYEYNKDGIGFTKIVSYMKKFIKQYHKNKDDLITYSLEQKNIVSRDFLKSLEKLNRIKAVTLTVEREDVGVSEMKAFAEYNDLSTDMDLVLKPTGKGNTIFGNTVKAFYDVYNNKKIPIKRITVEGDRATKEPLVFDTEKMKEKYPVEIAEDVNGEALTSDVFASMRKLSVYF